MGQAAITLADAGIVAGSTLNVVVCGATLYKCKGQATRGYKDVYTFVPPFHLLLCSDGVCRLAFIRTEQLDHAGGPDHYTTFRDCKNILEGTYVLESDDMAVCTWTKHFEFIPEEKDTFCLHGDPSAKLLRKGADASTEYQRIDLSKCVLLEDSDPTFSEAELPLSALGLGLFQADEFMVDGQ